MPETSGDDEGQSFSEFTLRGERFEGVRLPIDALAELERYRSLLLSAAAGAWQMSHPDSDVPSDFGAQFDLAIAEVRDGSAMAILEVPDSTYREYFEIGRDRVEQLFQDLVAGLAMPVLVEDLADAPEIEHDIESAEEVDGQAATTSSVDAEDNDATTPDEHLTRGEYMRFAQLPAFQEFGSNLLPGESAIMSLPVGTQVEITRATYVDWVRPVVDRVAELLSPPPVQRLHEENSVAGRLIGINADKKNYTVRTLLYGLVNGRYKEDEMTADLKAVLDSSSQAPVVRITGRMSWKDGQLEKILEAQEVELLEVEGEPWSRRIVELASLQRGWDDESSSGEPISFAAIEAAREFLRDIGKSGLPAPRAGIFPMNDGGVLVEWTTSDRVVSAEVSPDGAAYYVHKFVLDPRSSSEHETADLSDAIRVITEGLS